MKTSDVLLIILAVALFWVAFDYEQWAQAQWAYLDIRAGVDQFLKILSGVK